MGGGGGGDTSTTTAMIPPALMPLFTQTAGSMMDLQNVLPMFGPAAWNPGGYQGSAAPDEAGGGGGGKNKANKDPAAQPAGQLDGVSGQTTGAVNPTTQNAYAGDAKEGTEPDVGGGGKYGHTPGGAFAGAQATGDWGFVGENPRQVAGNSPFQDEAMGQLRGYQNTYASKAANAANNMGSMAQRMWDQNPQRLQDAYGRANKVGQNANQMMGGELNPQASRAAEGFESVHAQGQQGVTGDMIQHDPVLAAQEKAFNLTAKPMLNNQFGSMGLGRSGALGGAMADSWAKAATPLMQEAAAREERGIDRGINATNAASQGMASLGNQYIDQFNSGTNAALGSANALNSQYQSQLDKQNSAMAGMGQYAQMKGQQGQQAWDQSMGKMDREFGWGSQMRDQEQEGYNSSYDDFLRRQGLAEQALFAPFNMMGNTIGQKSTSGGGGK